MGFIQYIVTNIEDKDHFITVTGIFKDYPLLIGTLW